MVEERIENRRRELIVNQKGFILIIRKCIFVLDICVMLKVIVIVVVIIGLVVYGLVFFFGDIIFVFNFIYIEILNKKVIVEFV